MVKYVKENHKSIRLQEIFPGRIHFVKANKNGARLRKASAHHLRTIFKLSFAEAIL